MEFERSLAQILTPRKGRKMIQTLRRVVLGAVLSLGFASAAHAIMWVDVDTYVILDGGFGDLDGLINDVIVFDSLAAPPNNFTTLSGFDAKGTVNIGPVGGALAGSLNTGQVLVLTNFVADMPVGGTPGAFNIVFEHTFPGGPIPGGGTAADTVVAFANDGTGSAPYLPGTSAVPLLLGEDLIVMWQGYVDNVAIPNPSAPAPALPNLPGLDTPYQVFGHATINPLFGGVIFNPILRGELRFFLGGQRNQFVLKTSAEVGLEELAIPAPGLSMVGFVILAAAIIVTARSRMTTSQPA